MRSRKPSSSLAIRSNNYSFAQVHGDFRSLAYLAHCNITVSIGAIYTRNFRSL